MSPNEDFGRYLRRLREKRSLSVNQLARLVGVSGAEMSRIERGVRQKINPYLLRKLAPLLGVEVLDLMKKAGFLPAGKPLLRTREGSRVNNLLTKAEQLSDTDLLQVEQFMDSLLESTGEPGDEGSDVQ